MITTDTTLRADLIGCVGDGLVVAADGITLNLNGHVVTGDTLENPDDVGIRVTGQRDVTVTNGSVGGFWRGVLFEESPDGLATDLSVHDNTRRGIVFADGSDRGQVRHNVSKDNRASGIAIVASDGGTVSHNRSLGNIGGAGVRLEGATYASVTNNALNGDSFGLQIEDGADNRITDNTMADEEETSVAIEFSGRNFITRNRMTHSGGGVSIGGGNDNVITDNQILHSIGPDGIGIQIVGSRNLIARNSVVDSVRYGIEVDDFQEPGYTPATANILRGNVVNGGGEGIAIGPEAGGTVLNTIIEHNVVIGALDDGIKLVGPSTGLQTSTLTRNVALHNHDLGINAPPGTRDGGGNHAAGNGNPQQCLNITCR